MTRIKVPRTFSGLDIAKASTATRKEIHTILETPRQSSSWIESSSIADPNTIRLSSYGTVGELDAILGIRRPRSEKIKARAERLATRKYIKAEKKISSIKGITKSRKDQLITAQYLRHLDPDVLSTKVRIEQALTRKDKLKTRIKRDRDKDIVWYKKFDKANYVLMDPDLTRKGKLKTRIKRTEAIGTERLIKQKKAAIKYEGKKVWEAESQGKKYASLESSYDPALKWKFDESITHSTPTARALLGRPHTGAESHVPIKPKHLYQDFLDMPGMDMAEVTHTSGTMRLHSKPSLITKGGKREIDRGQKIKGRIIKVEQHFEAKQRGQVGSLLDTDQYTGLPRFKEGVKKDRTKYSWYFQKKLGKTKRGETVYGKTVPYILPSNRPATKWVDKGKEIETLVNQHTGKKFTRDASKIEDAITADAWLVKTGKIQIEPIPAYKTRTVTKGTKTILTAPLRKEYINKKSLGYGLRQIKEAEDVYRTPRARISKIIDRD